MDETKPAWQSRTIVGNAIVGVATILLSLGIFPSVDAWVQAHPEAIIMCLSGAGILLRLVTKDKISIWG